MPTSNLAIDFGAGVSQAWTSIATFVPKLVAFVVILVIGWFIAKVLAKVLTKVLEKVGFDRVAERGGLKDTLARSNYTASGILAKLVYYAVLLITLQLAFISFGPNPISNLLSGIVSWLPRAFVAVIIIVVVAAIARAVKEMVSNALSGVSYGSLLGTIASVFIWGFGIIAALNQIGVATAVTTPILVTVLATLGGVAIVGLGGGLVKPMQSRWDRWLGNIEQEAPALRGQAQAYQERMRADPARHAVPSGYETQSHAQQQYASAPQHGSAPQYGSASQYGSAPQYGEAPPRYSDAPTQQYTDTPQHGDGGQQYPPTDGYR